MTSLADYPYRLSYESVESESDNSLSAHFYTYNSQQDSEIPLLPSQQVSSFLHDGVYNEGQESPSVEIAGNNTYRRVEAILHALLDDNALYSDAEQYSRNANR